MSTWPMLDDSDSDLIHSNHHVADRAAGPQRKGLRTQFFGGDRATAQRVVRRLWRRLRRHQEQREAHAMGYRVLGGSE